MFWWGWLDMILFCNRKFGLFIALWEISSLIRILQGRNMLAIPLSQDVPNLP